MSLKEQMINACAELDIALDDKTADKFLKYMDILKEWNAKFNLTAITDDREIILKHFVDSLALLKFIGKKSENLKVIDIGTGAGFPGIPIKLVRDDFNVTLVDSLNKKVNFLNIVIAELGLTNISAFHLRAEDGAAITEYRQMYDLCLSRAVAKLSVLCEYCLPYVKMGGQFIAYKGFDIEAEIEEAENAVKILGGRLDKIEKITIPGSDYGRSLVFISKISNTSPKYPRNQGIINKNPIK